MDLEKINKEYVELKAKLEQEHKDLEELKNKAENLKEDYYIAKGEFLKSKRGNDIDGQKEQEDIMETIKKEMDEIKETAEKKKEEMKSLNEKLSERVNELIQNPAMKDHVAQVLSVKYERKISKLEKEKEEKTNNRDKLVKLKQLFIEHPTLANNLKGIMTAQKEITDLTNELEELKSDTAKSGYKNAARANKIINTLLPQANEKLNTNKSLLMGYINKKELGFSEEDIKKLTEKELVLDSKGNLDIGAMMDKDIASLNRQIKGLDKSIADHTTVLNRFNAREAKKVEQEGKTTGEASKKDASDLEQENGADEETPQLKWYQKIVNKFKNWNEKRKQKALPKPEPTEEKEEEEKAEKVEKVETTDNFKDSLKYDIVQDIVNRQEKVELHKAKEFRKEVVKQVKETENKETSEDNGER